MNGKRRPASSPRSAYAGRSSAALRRAERFAIEQQGSEDVWRAIHAVARLLTLDERIRAAGAGFYYDGAGIPRRLDDNAALLVTGRELLEGTR